MTVLPASNMDVKRRNRINTLRCILSCERISQMELTRQLALSWPTILQNVKELTDLGLVREDGLYESTGGRKAKAYAPVPDARLAAGLDLTQDRINMVLVDLGGQVVASLEMETPFSLSDDYMVCLGQHVQSFVKEHGAGERLLGLGISLPGIVDSQSGLLRDSHVLDIQNIPLRRFSDPVPWRCSFLNDANAAGLAEVYGRPVDGDLVYLSLSDSVGGAILRNGQLSMGRCLRAGEFGHTTLVPDGRRCYCGKDGCLDAYCSAKVLSSCTGGSLTAFFEQLQAGNPEMAEIWQEYLEYLAIAVNNLHISFDCDVVVGGYVGAYLEEFIGPLRTLLEARNTFGPDASYLKLCQRRRDASAAGAALTQIEDFFQTI